MRYFMAALVAMMLATFSDTAFAGNCDHSYDTAKDGSRCGDRAADQRDGGR
jgi:hypothetical protein